MPNQEELLRRVQEKLDRKYKTLDPATYGESSELGGSRDSQGFQSYTPQEVDKAQRYDVNLTPGADLNESLYEAQGRVDMWIKAGQRLIGSTLYKSAAGFGYLGAAVNPDNFGEGYVAAVADNAWSNFFESAEQDMKDRLPIFKNKAYEDASTLSKLGSAAFWTDDVVDGVAFLFSNWGPAFGVKGLALGTRLTKQLAKGSSAYKGLAGAAEAEQFLAPSVAKWAEGLDKVTQFGVLSSIESFTEANGVYQEMKQKAAESYQKGEVNLNEYLQRLEDAKEGAAQSYALNMTVLAPSNLFELNLINKISGKAAGKVDNVVSGALGQAKAAPKSLGKTALQDGALGIVAEGAWEENIQFGIEEAANSLSAENRGKSFLENYLDNISKVLTSTADVGSYSKERWTSIALGSIIGAPGGALGGYKQAARENKQATAVAKSIEDSYKIFQAADIYLRKEDGSLELEDGKPVIDPEKQAKIDTRLKTLQELDHVLQDMEDGQKAQAVVDYTKGRAFTNLAQSYYHAGLYDQFKEQLKDKQDLDPKFLRHAEKLENLFKTNETGLFQDKTENARAIKLNEIGGDILFLNDLISNLEKQSQEKEKELIDQFETSPALAQLRELTRQKAELEFKIQAFEAGKKFGTFKMPNKPKVGDTYKVEGDWGLGLSYAEIISTPSAAAMKESMEAALTEVNEKLRETEQSLKDNQTDLSQVEMIKRLGQKELDLIALQKAELEATRFVRGKQFETLVSPKGAKAYKQALAKMGTALDPSTFNFEGATKESYKEFENAVIGAIRYGLNKKNVDRKYAGVTLVEDAKKGQMDKILSAFSDPNFMVDPQQAEEIKKLVEDYIEQTSIQIPLGIDDDFLTEVSEEGKKLQGILPNIEKSLVPYSEPEEEEIKLEAAKQRIKLADEVIQNFERSSEYSNVEEAEKQTKVLQKLLSLIDDRIQEPWASFKERLKEKISLLEEVVIPELKRRKEDREKQIDRVVAQHAKENFLALGITETGELTDFGKLIDQQLEGALTNILTKAKADGMKSIYALAIFNKIGQLSAEKKKIVLDAIKARRALLINAVKPLLQEGFIQHQTAIPTAFLDNPVQYLRALIKQLADTSNGVDSGRDSAVKKWLSTYDFARFKDELQYRPDGSYSTKTLTTLLELYEELSAIHHAETFIAGDGLLPYEILSEISALKEVPNLTPASEEQLLVVRELISFLQNPEESPDMFGNFAYLSGFAGTGKTNLVARWIKAILGIEGANIYAASLTEKASEELNASIGKAGSLDNLANLLKALETPISFTPNIILIDEVTRLTEDQIKELGTKVQALNEYRKAHKFPAVKVVCLGDPNQLQATGNRPDPTLDDGVSHSLIPGIAKIRVIRSLSTRFRSNVQAVNDFQELFISENRDMSQPELIAKASSSDPLREGGTQYGVVGLSNPLTQVRTWIAGQNLTDGKRRTIITTQERKALYAEAVEGTNIEVLTVQEVQGLTREQVFVDMPFAGGLDFSTYNTELYTAFSRATELLMVANLNITNASDPSIRERVVQRESDNKKRAEEFINKRIAEFENIVEFFPGIAKDAATSVAQKKATTRTEGNAEISAALGVPASTEVEQAAPVSTEGKEFSQPAEAGQPQSPQPEPMPQTPEEEEEEEEEEGEEEQDPEEQDEVIPEEELADDVPNETEVNIPDEVDQAPAESFRPVYVNSNTIKKTFVGDDTQTQVSPGYSAGDEVIFVKTQQDKLVVLAKHTEEPNTYIEVAVLSAEEVESLGLTEKYKSAPAAFDSNPKNEYFQRTIPDAYILAKARILAASETKYIYGVQEPLTPNSLKETISKVVSSVVRSNNTAVALNYALKNATVNIFTRKDIKNFASAASNRTELARTLIPGRMYLMIPIRTTPTGKIFYQAVQLPRREFDRSPSSMEEHFKALNEFISTVDKLGEVLGKKFPGLATSLVYGTAYMNEFIRKVGKGDFTGGFNAIAGEFGLAGEPGYKDIIAQQGFTYDKVITSEVVDLCRKAYLLFEVPKGDRQTLAVQVGDTVKNHKNRFTIQVATKDGKIRESSSINGKITKIVDGVATVVYTPKKGDPVTVESPVEELYTVFDETQIGVGEAQKELNRLALSNTMFNDVVIRATEQRKRKGSTATKVFTGKKLLFYGSGKYRNTQNSDGEVLNHVKATSDKYRKIDGNSERADKYLAKVAETLQLPLNLNILRRIVSPKAGEFVNYQPVPRKIVDAEGGAHRFRAETMDDKGKNILNTDADAKILSSLANINLSKVRPTTVVLSKPEINQSASKGAAPTASKPGRPGRPSAPVEGFSMEKVEGEEVAEFNLISSKKALAYLRQVFPNFNPDDLRIVSQSVLMRLTGGKEAWGFFKKGVIFLEDNAEGIYEQVLKHEAMHKISEYHLTNEERQKISQEFGVDVKEELSNRYMEWKTGKRTELWLSRVFRKIRQILGFYNRSFSTLEEFFEKVEKGEFASLSSEQAVEIEGSPLLKILKNFGSPANFIIMKNSLASSIDRFSVYNPEGYDFYTREQARDMMKEDWSTLNYVPESKATKEDRANPDVHVVPDISYEAIMFYREMKKQDKSADLIDVLFRHFYNKSTFSGIAEDDSTEDLPSGEVDTENEFEDPEEEEKEKANLRDHIEEADRIDRSKKLFKSAKDFIGTVFLQQSKGVRTLMSSKTAFAILAKKLGNFSTESDTEFREDIKELLSLDEDSRSKAVKDKFMYILEDSLKKDFVSAENNYVYDLNNPEQSGEMTYSSIKEEQPDRYVYGDLVFDRASNQDNYSWFEEISDKTGVPFDVLAVLYKKERAVDMINALVTGTGSLREKNPHKITEEDPTWVQVEGQAFPVKKTRYIPLEVDYAKLTLKGEVANRLKLIIDNGTLQTLFKELETKVADAGNSSIKAGEHLHDALSKLGLLKKPELPLYIPLNEVSTLKDLKEIVGTLLRLSSFESPDRVPSSEKDIYTTTETNSEGTYTRLLTPAELLSSQNKARLDKIQIAIASQLTSHELNTVYQGAGKKRRWIYTVGSQAHDILQTLALKARYPNLKGFSLKFANTAFYRMNPFLHEQQVMQDGKLISKKLGVGRIIDHDSMDKGNFNIMYKEESLLQVFERMMFSGFTPNTSTVTGINGKRSYFQFNMVNSNKPETRATEVNMLTLGDARAWIAHILKQESQRPGAAVKSYTPQTSNLPVLSEDGNLMFPEVIKDPSDEKAVQKRVKDFEQTMEKQVQSIIKVLIDSKFTLPGNYTDNLRSLQAQGFLSLTEEQWQKLNSTEFIKANTNKHYAIEPWMIEDYVRLFVYNNMVNGYYLNQITLGDESFFKNSYDVIKRMSIAWATGYRGRVSDDYGVPKKFSTMVIKDEKEKFANVMSEMLKNPALKRLLGESFNRTDAQGFVTQKFANKLKKGFGRGMQLGNILKPVHYEIDSTGVPRAIKYSAVVLSDALIQEFPELRTLAEYMETHQVDQAVFESAVKVGLPLNIPTWSEIQQGTPLAASAKFDLQGQHFRIQLNPRHELDSHVTQPSQLLYFLLSNPANWDKAMDTYKSIAKMQEVRSVMTNEHFALRGRSTSYGMTIINAARARLKKFIIQTLSKSAHTVTTAEMLAEKGLSLNFPTVQTASKFMFNSAISKRVVEINYPGTKMVLQSDIGTTKLGMDKPKIIELQGGKYAHEAYVPKGFAEKHGLKVGDLVVGFRIPSTELHSGAPLVIKGFIEDPLQDNVIITTSEFTWLHGSDFDVDALFIVHRQAGSKDIYSFDKQTLLYKAKDNSGNPILFNHAHEVAMGKEFDKLRQLLHTSQDNAQKEEIRKYLYGTMSSHKDSLAENYTKALENKVLYNLLEIIEDPANREAMFSPISMKGLKIDSEEEANPNQPSLFELIRDWRGLKSISELFVTRFLHFPMDYGMMHQDNFSGAKGTGIFANATKGYNYLFGATGSKDVNPELNENLQFRIGGLTYTHLSKYEKNADGTDRYVSLASGEKVIAKVGERFDAMINAAIDNVKEQILSVANITGQTMSSWVGLTAVGMPMEQIGALMQNPIIYQLNQIKGSSSKAIKKARTELLERLMAATGAKSQEEALKLITSKEVTLEDIHKDILKDVSTTSPLQGLDKEALINQFRLLEIFERGDAIGAAIGDYSSIANLAKAIPSASWDQAEIRSLITRYYQTEKRTLPYRTKSGNLQYITLTSRLKKDADGKYIPKEGKSMPFTNVNILEYLPHIRTAFAVVENQLERQSAMFTTSNMFLQGLMKRILAKYTVGLNFGKGRYHTLESMIEEFSSFNISRAKIGYEGKIVIDMECANEAPVIMHNATSSIVSKTIEELEAEGSLEQYTVYTGQQAWAARFVERVGSLMAQSDNAFLKALTPSGQQLRFYLAGQVEPEDIAKFQKAFMDLNETSEEYSPLQWDFVKYLLISSGAKYGASNYATILPASIFVPVDKAINTTMQDVLDKAQEAYSTALQANKLDELKAAREQEKKNKVSAKQSTIAPLIKKAFEEAGTAASEILYNSFFQYSESFALQLAINHADKLTNVKSDRIVKDESGNKRGVEVIKAGETEIPVYYDLKLTLPTQTDQSEAAEQLNNANASEEDLEAAQEELVNAVEGPKIVAYYGTLYVRVDLPEGVERKFLYYQEAGKAGKLKKYLKPSTGTLMSDVFNPSIPVRVVKNPVGLTTFTDKSNSPLMKQGSIIGFRSYTDVGRNSVSFYRIESAQLVGTSKVYTLRREEGEKKSVDIISEARRVQQDPEFKLKLKIC